MEKADVVVKRSEPSELANVVKPNKIRIYIDPSDLNNLEESIPQ